MDLAASIVLFAAASLLFVAAFYLLRYNRMPWRSQKLVLDAKLPDLGDSGSITEAQMHKLRERGIITPYQTWLSTEQADLLLECGIYVEAIWSRSMGASAPLPMQARKVCLNIMLGHGSYCDDARMWVRHESSDTDPPGDACAHHLKAVLRQWALDETEAEPEREPVTA